MIFALTPDFEFKKYGNVIVLLWVPLGPVLQYVARAGFMFMGHCVAKVFFMLIPVD